MANYLAYLKHGNKRLNLDGTDGNGTDTTGGMWLGSDFAPPPPQYQGGRDGAPLELQTRTMRLPLHVKGGGTSSSDKIKRLYSQLQGFLALAQDPAHDLYFCYRSHADYPFEPIFGQTGACTRYRVQSGLVRPSTNFNTAALSKTGVPNNEIVLTVDPWALGNKQLALPGRGAAMMHDFATPDGVPRGFITPPNGTNLIGNCIFENATWNDGWTNGADTVGIQNRDPEYIIYGQSSVMFASSSNVNRRYTYSINLTDGEDYTFACFIKLPDGGEVSDTQVILYNDAGVDVTTNYQEMGNGWWLVYGTWTADATAATEVGIAIKPYYTLYMDMAWMENQSYLVPPYFGDMVGVTWDGTAHDAAAESDRTAPLLTLRTGMSYGPQRFLMDGGGTIRVTLMPWVDHDFASDMNILYQLAGFVLHYDAGNNRFEFTDGTNVANGAEQSFDAFDIITVYATWSKAGGLDLYVNGTASGSGNATYIPPNTSSVDTYVGASNAGAGNFIGTFLGITIFDRPMTATQVAADYVHVNALANMGDGLGARVDWAPWYSCYTTAQIDAYTDATNQNWCVFGDIGGDVNAETQWIVQSSQATPGTTISILESSTNFVDKSQFFKDQSGTATGATEVGGQVKTTSVGTTWTDITNTTIQFTTKTGVLALLGNKLALLTRLADAGSGLSIRTKLSITNTTLYSEPISVSADATYRYFETEPIYVPNISEINRLISYGMTVTVVLQAKRATGSANVTVDYYGLLPGRYARLETANGSSEWYILSSKDAYAAVDGTFNINEILDVVGSSPDLASQKYNYVVFGSDGIADACVIGDTYTLFAIYVTPRWRLI